MTEPEAPPLVVFDGICNFCAGSVQLILRHDRRSVFRFAPMQSRLGAEQMRRFGLDPSDTESFLLVKNGRGYVRSDAALEIARDLAPPYRWLVALRLLPRVLRDAAYTWLARNRYRWFGRRAACFLPSAEQRSRFLDSATTA